MLTTRILAQELTPNGYSKVKLSAPALYPNVHVLVLKAFMGDRPYGAVARHLNDIKTDNRLSNLAWGTASENAKDAKRNGKLLHGERHPFAKLTRDIVESIRASRATQTELAQRYGVSRRAIGMAKRGTTWAQPG
jgi:hypothetical protein